VKKKREEKKEKLNCFDLAIVKRIEASKLT